MATAWPGLNYATYKRSYNLDTGAFGEEFARSRSEGGKSFNTLSFSVPGRLQATLVLDERNLVTRVESVMPHPAMGDTAASVEFLDDAPNPAWAGCFRSASDRRRAAFRCST